MSFQLTKEYIDDSAESIHMNNIFDIFTATQICRLNDQDRIRAINESLENDEQRIIDIVNFLKETLFFQTMILKSFDLTIDSLFKHVSKLSLDKVYSTSEKALFKYIPPKQINKVKLMKSPVHGNGVFATQTLEKGDIVTFYPVHVLLHGNCSHVGDTFYEDYHDYIYGINRHIAIAGRPVKSDNPSYLGHMINDGSSTKNRSTYEKYSKERANCSFLNVIDVDSICYCVVIVAKRHIELGEELFLSYGLQYWSTR